MKEKRPEGVTHRAVLAYPLEGDLGNCLSTVDEFRSGCKSIAHSLRAGGVGHAPRRFEQAESIVLRG